MGSKEGTIDRRYLRTHSWLKYSVDLRRMDAQTWIDLGECKSKCEHIAGVPLKPGIERNLLQIYLAKGALATTAIEGNTLSEREVRDHLEGKLRLAPSRQYLAQEIDNIVDACNDMLSDISSEVALPLTVDSTKILNALVLRNLELEEGVVPGEIRGHDVGVGRYKGAPHEDCEYLLERLFEWLNGPIFVAPPGMGIVFAILKAVLAHLYLAWIHPFGDGNGRIARLLEFQILIASGVPAPAAHLLSNHYNQTRAEYYRQLDRASSSGGDVISFTQYAVGGFLEGLRTQLADIRVQQWDVAWENYIHETFKEKKGESNQRRKYLVLDLSSIEMPVPIGKLRQISPRMADAYANMTNKAVSRDVNALVKLDLVEKTSAGVRARRERILAFLPLIAEGAESTPFG